MTNGGESGRDARPLLGIALILICTGVFASLDALGKALIARYPVWEILFFRYCFFLAVMVLWVRPRMVWGHLVSVRRPWLQVVRSGMSVADQVIFITGLSFLALADAHVVVAMGPLLVTALSVPFLGETVGIRRWAAVSVGFLGVVFVLQPGGDLFRPASLFPVASAFLFAFYQITTRIVNATDSGKATLLYTSGVGAVIFALLAPFGWVTPQGGDWALLLVLAILALIAHSLLIQALKWAPAAVLQPFFYATLIWAIGLGWLVFDELPGPITLAGALVIVASGLYTVHRERVAARQGG